MKLSPQAQSTLILVAAGLLVLWYLKGQAGAAAEKAVEAVNPADQNNLINRLFNWGYQGVTGSEGTAGTDFAAWLHEDDIEEG